MANPSGGVLQKSPDTKPLDNPSSTHGEPIDNPSGGVLQKSPDTDTDTETYTETYTGTQCTSNRKRKEKTFSRPSLDQVTAYCAERGNAVDPKRWLDYYESNGFRVGKNRMVDWQAAVRTWERSDFGRDNSPRQINNTKEYPEQQIEIPILSCPK
jgi:hypothetical protein